MMRVHLPDRGSYSFVHQLHRRKERIESGIVGNRLVQQIIAEHRRVVVIVPGQSLPDRDRVLLGAGVAEQPRIAIAVVDIFPVCPPGAACISRMM